MQYAVLVMTSLSFLASCATLYAMFKTKKKVEITINTTQAVADSYKIKVSNALAELAK